MRGMVGFLGDVSFALLLTWAVSELGMWMGGMGG